MKGSIASRPAAALTAAATQAEPRGRASGESEARMETRASFKPPPSNGRPRAPASRAATRRRCSSVCGDSASGRSVRRAVRARQGGGLVGRGEALLDEEGADDRARPAQARRGNGHRPSRPARQQGVELGQGALERGLVGRHVLAWGADARSMGSPLRKSGRLARERNPRRRSAPSVRSRKASTPAAARSSARPEPRSRRPSSAAPG